MLDEVPQVCPYILENSPECLPIFDDACVETAMRIFCAADNSHWTMKNKIHFRVGDVPSIVPNKGSTLPRVKHIWKYRSFSGYVTKVTTRMMLEFTKEVTCQKCGTLNVLEATFYEYYRFPQEGTNFCQNALCKSKLLTSESSKNVNVKKYLRDYQEFKIQEIGNKKNSGSVPTSVWVTSEDDLVDLVKPGDNVTVW